MDLFKKLALSSFMSLALLATAPTAMAKPLGKIENATPAQTAQTIDETIVLAEESLAAIQSGGEIPDVLAKLKETKQSGKNITSTVVFAIRDKALARLKKARSYYKKGNTETSEGYMEEALEIFKKLKVKYHTF